MTEWLARLSASRRIVNLFWFLNAVMIIALLLFATRAGIFYG